MLPAAVNRSGMSDEEIFRYVSDASTSEEVNYIRYYYSTEITARVPSSYCQWYHCKIYCMPLS